MSKCEPKLYLCGGINGLSDREAKGWRERVKAFFPAAIDPMARDYRGKELNNAKEIVDGDLKDIIACDIVFANCERPSWGTAMEIFYAAHVLGKVVIAVVPDRKHASPWLAHHATLVDSINAGIDFVEALYK